MGASHERLLTEITSEFPVQVEKITNTPEMEPPVSMDYLRELCGDDGNLIALLEDMIEYFYRYTKDVCEQESLIKKGIQENLEEIQLKDGPRTILHNTMIDSVKIFARNLREKGKDASWIENIDKKSRIGYAQLALLTTYHDIINQDRNQ
jgi:hypothetical protein